MKSKNRTFRVRGSLDEKLKAAAAPSDTRPDVASIHLRLPKDLHKATSPGG